MVVVKEITGTKEREFVYPEKRVWLPHLTTAKSGSIEHQEWANKNWWMVDYSVFRDNKPEAVELAADLDAAFKRDPNDEMIPGILKKLQLLRTKDHDKLTPLERWTRNAFQLVEYAGGPLIKKEIAGRLSGYTGDVLEAMCGHESYFMPSQDRSVTQLDFCTESLEKHRFPERRRICCDLDQVGPDSQIPLFKDGEFDAISVCFGFKYPTRIESVLGEFRRILRRGGTLSFVENPRHGYEDLCRRRFRPQVAVRILKESGFEQVNVSVIKPPKDTWNSIRGKFYHLTGIKP